MPDNTRTVTQAYVDLIDAVTEYGKAMEELGRERTEATHRLACENWGKVLDLLDVHLNGEATHA